MGSPLKCLPHDGLIFASHLTVSKLGSAKSWPVSAFSDSFHMDGDARRGTIKIGDGPHADTLCSSSDSIARAN